MTLLSGCSDGGEENEEEADEPEQPDEQADPEETEEPEDDEGTAPDETIVLLGLTDGWQGVEPGEIADETNPPLTLQVGTTYELTWENGDGAEHELIIEDGEGIELEASDSSEEEGEMVTLTFETIEEMGAYYCEYHPESMRGEISVE